MHEIYGNYWDTFWYGMHFHDSVKKYIVMGSKHDQIYILKKGFGILEPIIFGVKCVSVVAKFCSSWIAFMVASIVVLGTQI